MMKCTFKNNNLLCPICTFLTIDLYKNTRNFIDNKLFSSIDENLKNKTDSIINLGGWVVFDNNLKQELNKELL